MMSIKTILMVITMRSKNAWAWCKSWCKNKWKQLKQLEFLDRLIIIFGVVSILVMFIPWLSESIGYLLGTGNKKETITFIGIGIGGLVLWQRSRSAKEQVDAMVATTERQTKANEITETGHVQERLKTSIEHLGDSEESICIGAAYELYHLATDREDYRETVCRILCGHIRQKTQKENYQKQHANKPSEEIQTCLNLLCGKEKEHVFSSCQRNLTSSFLKGANLKKAQLEGANLDGAQLQGSNLDGAQLQGSNLKGAQLQDAILARSQLQGSNLKGAQLQKANLWKAQLQKANLLRAQLQGSNLKGAQLQKANLLGAQLQKANLLGAQLQKAGLARAQLQGANLLRAQLQEANLLGAQLQGAILARAQLQGASLWEAQIQGAVLVGAQLQGANLLGAQLQGANLLGAQLQGVSSLGAPLHLTFQEWIRKRIGQEHDFTNVTFSGGLSADRAKEIIASIPSGVEAKKLESKLSEHIDQVPSNKLPENSGAITGKYSSEESEQWIEEYNKAMEILTVPLKSGQTHS